jgi:hypothetical protein
MGAVKSRRWLSAALTDAPNSTGYASPSLLHPPAVPCTLPPCPCPSPPALELREAIAEWQGRHAAGRVLSTGFLDGTHPIVDAYELGVRLEHMLRRLAALSGAASTQVGRGRGGVGGEK